MDTVLKHFVSTFSRNFPEYKEALSKRIQDTSESVGIFPENYAFDIRGVSSLYWMDQKEEEEAQKPKEKSYWYKPMTDTEIEEARRHIGV